MTTLSKQQVSDIIKNAPAGTNAGGIVAALRQKGYQLEGYDDQTKSIAVPQKSAYDNSLLGKVDKAVTSVMEPVSNFMFGSTAKTVGSMLTAPVLDMQGKHQEAQQLVEKNITPTNIAFTALELWPGGGKLGKLLEKIPGGAKLAEGVAEHLGAIPKALQEKAVEQYASIFRATSKESKSLVSKVAPTMLENKQIVTSVPKLAEKARENVVKLGGQINKVVSKIPEDVTTNLAPVVNKLEAMKGKYMINGKVVDTAKTNIINDVQQKIAQFGEKIATQDTIQLRRILDESVNDAGGFIADKATKFTAKIEKIASDTIRNELAKDIPDLAKVNEQYSFWSNVKKLANYTAGKQSTVLRRSLAGGVGGTIGGLETPGGIGSKAGGAVVGAILGERAIQFMKSPAWKSVSAITKNQIAENIAKGNKSELLQIFKRLGIGIKNLTD